MRSPITPSLSMSRAAAVSTMLLDCLGTGSEESAGIVIFALDFAKKKRMVPTKMTTSAA